MITTDTHVFFYGGHPYSNWHLSGTARQFHDPNADLWFNTSEHAFMYRKALFFRDQVRANMIAEHAAANGHPSEVKAMGRQIVGFHQKSWELVREGLMAYVCWLKFAQNSDWGAELKSTGKRILVEASRVDKIWGVGLSVEAAAREAEEQPKSWSFNESLHAEIEWPGLNLLGKSLMTVRGMV